MKFIINGEDIKKLNGFICCDCDFLNIISTDEVFFRETIELFPGRLVLDPFTKLEFLREVYNKEQRKIKEQFIENAFIPFETNQEGFLKIFNDALTISRLYAHNKKTGISLVDLMLAARVKNSASQLYIATGNAKDFGSIIFDVVAIINFRQNDGNMRAISILRFNQDSFLKAQENYAKIGKTT